MSERSIKNNRKVIPGCEPIFYQGNKVGCLLLHGFTSSPFEMRFLADYLKIAGYTVSAPLLPGHGTSPVDLKKCTWFDWWNEAKHALFELRKKCNRIYVLGLSMGGTLALHLSAHYQVDAVVSIAPGLYLKNKLSHLSHLVHPVYQYDKKWSGADIRANEKVITYPKIPVKSLSQLLKFFKHFKADLIDIYVPVMIIYAKEDHVVDNKGAEEIYQTISSKDKRILELKKSYHLITLDIEREKVFTEISVFFEHLS